MTTDGRPGPCHARVRVQPGGEAQSAAVPAAIRLVVDDQQVVSDAGRQGRAGRRPGNYEGWRSPRVLKAIVG